VESWMHREDRKVTAQEIALLERARKTLEGNLAMPGEGHVDPLPWHPLRGIRPSLDEYDGIWNWDSAFHAVAVSRWDPELAREQIRILLDAQLPSGALPDVLFMNGEIVDRFGKPPVMPWAMMLVDRRDPDDAFLALAYDRFVDYEAFWRRERGGEEEGLFHYDSDSDDPAERLDDAKLESGWDDSVRFDEASFDLWPVDLNCFMVMLYRAMSTLAVRCGRNADIESWQSKAQALSDRIEAKLWDEVSGRYAGANGAAGGGSRAVLPRDAHGVVRRLRVPPGRVLAWTHVAQHGLLRASRSEGLRLRCDGGRLQRHDPWLVQRQRGCDLRALRLAFRQGPGRCRLFLERGVSHRVHPRVAVEEDRGGFIGL